MQKIIRIVLMVVVIGVVVLSWRVTEAKAQCACAYTCTNIWCGLPDCDPAGWKSACYCPWGCGVSVGWCNPGYYWSNKKCVPIGAGKKKKDDVCYPGKVTCSACSTLCGPGRQHCWNGCQRSSRYCAIRSCCNAGLCASGVSSSQACGSTTINYSCTNQCGGVNSWTGSGACKECASYGYSLCTAPSYTQTYQTYCSGQQTQDCTGTITGTLVDASDLSVCASFPGIIGATITATRSSDGAVFTVVTDGSGNYSLPSSSTMGIPDIYTLTVETNGRYIDDSIKFPGCDTASMVIDFLPTTAQTQTINKRVGLWKKYGGWWQVTGGDVYGETGVQSIIPATCPINGCDSRLIIADADGEDGLVHYGEGSVFTLGTAPYALTSTTDWSAESAFKGQSMNYEYYMTKMTMLDKTEWDGSGKPAYSSGSDGYEIYTYTGDVVIDFAVSSGEKMIFMIDGNVTVDNDNVVVPVGGHLTVISSGTVTFSSNVTQAQGWWLADVINIASMDDEDNELQFNGEGTFVGWDSFSFNRDRGERNNSEPSETFVFRPDMMVNAPDALKLTKYQFQEVAP